MLRNLGLFYIHHNLKELFQQNLYSQNKLIIILVEISV